MNLSDLQPVYGANWYAPPDATNYAQYGQGGVDYDQLNQGFGQQYESKNLLTQRAKDTAFNDALANQKSLQSQHEGWLSGLEAQYPGAFSQDQTSQQQAFQPGNNDALDDLFGYANNLVAQLQSQQQSLQQQQQAFNQQYAQNQPNFQLPALPTPQPQHDRFNVPQNLASEMGQALEVFAGGIDQLQAIFGTGIASQIDAIRHPIYQQAIGVYQQTGNINAAADTAVESILGQGGNLMGLMGINLDIMNQYDVNAWRQVMKPIVVQLLANMSGVPVH